MYLIMSFTVITPLDIRDDRSTTEDTPPSVNTGAAVVGCLLGGVIIVLGTVLVVLARRLR